LAVDYEDMASDLEGVAASVFDFLGLGACSVQEVTRKQVGDQQRSKISNLTELEDEYRRFCRRAGLPWQDKTRTNPPSVNA